MNNLLATALGILIGGILLAALGFLNHNYMEDTRDARYAATAGYVASSARDFANAQRTTILNSITTAGGNAVSYHVSDLITAGNLDPSTAATTPTGGTWCLMFRTYGGGLLQGALTVVGETAPKKSADAIQVAIDSAQRLTGIVSSNSAIGPDVNQPLNQFTGPNACAPGANAFIAIISDGDSIGTTNYLSRVAVPGNPSASTMATTLNMGGNPITNATTIQTTSNITDGGSLSVAGTETVTGASAAASYAASGPVTAATVSATTSITAPDFFQTSDERLKTDWRPILHPCETVAAIRKGTYLQTETKRRDVGVGADSVMAAGLPELVRDRPDGFHTVNYSGLLPVLMACLDELGAKVDAASAAR